MFAADPDFWKTYITRSRYSYEQIPDLTGKVAIVTGANTGIGYSVALGLAAHGAHVFMACRSQEKYNEAVKRMREDVTKQKLGRKGTGTPDLKLDFLELDLNDLTKVHAAADKFLQMDLPLHILVNNAGISITPWKLSADGVEQQFAVNYLGPFAFTMALIDRLKSNQPSRIVNVSSLGYEASVPGGINLDRINDPSEGDPSLLYGRSKFAMMLFTKNLARRLSQENASVYVNAIHPGIVDTDMCWHTLDEYGLIATYTWRLISKVIAYSPKQAALTPLYCATSPEIEGKGVGEGVEQGGGITGRFFIPIANELKVTPLVENQELQEKVWAYSEQLVKDKVKK
ncbi:hypothetical protein BG011_010173 [Mortierella polycephala]|uniref:NAD(P)-binding protein n=1 Tax=Mortierella polycephala TaxID=41804 RepID=A0A9P6TVZ0_9FUNG|nr:hypothetical protein BG011_010173 [Mortierella polycephala]